MEHSNFLTGIGLYTFGEAGRLIGVRAADLRRWLAGYSRQTAGTARQMPGLWSTQLEGTDLVGLGFHDLLEVRFVKRFRQAGVSLQTIRIASAHARELFGSPYPFTCRRFQTDGKTIFAEAVRESGETELLDLRKKQFAFDQVIRPSLYAGIEFDREEKAIRWFPARTKDVVLDPAIAFGKPVVRGANIRTDVLYQAYLAEEKNKLRIARLYEVPVKAIDAAIRFEERLAA